MMYKIIQGSKTLTSLIKNKLGIITPILVQLKPTFRCNMKCPYCSVHVHGTKIYPEKKEATTSEFYNLLEKYSNNGATILNITGGEPLLRKDIVELLKYSKKIGFYVILNTDGILLNNFLDNNEFVNSIDKLRISLDSPTIHDKIRGTKNTFDKITKNIKKARKKKVDVTINSVIFKDNFHEMESLCKLAKKLDSKITLTPANYYEFTVSSKKENPTKFNNINRELFVKKVKKLKKEYKNLVNTNQHLDHLINKEQSNKKCDALSYVATILPDGKLALPCEIYVKESIDIREKSIKEITKSGKFIQYKKKTGKILVCKECESRCVLFPQTLLNFRNILDLIFNWNL
ncbi:radical SAM protein [archaeon]|nr:radical SAM protein [archaeon]